MPNYSAWCPVVGRLRLSLKGATFSPESGELMGFDDGCEFLPSFVTVPLGVTEDRLIGTVNVQQSMSEGRLVP